MKRMYISLILISAFTLVSCDPDTIGKCEKNDDCIEGYLCVDTGCLELEPVTIITNTLHNTVVTGKQYETFIEASDGVPPYNWELEKGPPWMSIEKEDDVTAKISGFADVYGTSVEVVVNVMDSTIGRNNSTTVNYSLLIDYCQTEEKDFCHRNDGVKCQIGEISCIKGDWGPCENFVDSTDADHCGPTCDSCGQVSEGCVDGVCASCGDLAGVCADEQICCLGLCVDISSNNENCGECGNDCATLLANVINLQCTESICVYDGCADYYIDCDDLLPGCETSNGDPEHCGDCDNDCTQSEQGHVCIDASTAPRCGCEILSHCDANKICLNQACVDPTPTPTPIPTPTPTPTPTPECSPPCPHKQECCDGEECCSSEESCCPGIGCYTSGEPCPG